jgi:DNA polymerase-1
MSKKDVLLIDGDQFLYEVTSANEVECDWGDDLWTLHTDLGQCKKALTARLDGVRKRLSTPNFIFCLSDNENFRKDVLPSYKAQRKKVRKPLAYHALKKWAEEQFEIALFPKLEADDVMGIIATRGDPVRYIIVSEDKDMKTVPATVFRKGSMFTYHEPEADMHFLYQTLIGDITDGYKGCPNMGPKTADKLLAFDGESFDLVNTWAKVVKAFEAKDLTEADALQQARCARILRASDWDTTTQTVKLWTPQ